MKNFTSKFWGSAIALMFAATSLMAQIKEKMNTGIQDGVNSVKLWAGYLFGALAIIWALIVVYNMMSGQPQSRNSLIGLVTGILVWTLISFVFA
jgi:hypothetical protein